MSNAPEFMTHERIMTGEEYVSYADYLTLQRERDEARTLENAVDVIMAAPLPDILRLFRERGILATMTTTAKEGAK